MAAGYSKEKEPRKTGLASLGAQLGKERGKDCPQNGHSPAGILTACPVCATGLADEQALVTAAG